jgi:hypothetical protein
MSVSFRFVSFRFALGNADNWKDELTPEENLSKQCEHFENFPPKTPFWRRHFIPKMIVLPKTGSGHTMRARCISTSQ